MLFMFCILHAVMSEAVNARRHKDDNSCVVSWWRTDRTN